MSSTTPSTQTGARHNTALLPTLGLGGSARPGNGAEAGGAAFSDLLRDKIAAPKPEAPKAASPTPAAPAAQVAPAQPAAKARKAESHQEGPSQAAEGNAASAETEGETAATQEAGSTETRTDARSRRAAKGATGQALQRGSEAARAQQQPGEPVTVCCAADDTAAIPTPDAGEDTPADDSVDADASVAQAILQMINAPASAPVKAAAASTTGGTDRKAAEAAPDAPLQSLLPADGSAIAASAAKSASVQGQTAAAATAAAADQLKLGDAIDGQVQMSDGAQLARATEALAAPNAQTPGGGPGSFAAHLQALSNPRSAQAAGSSAPSAVALAQPLHSPEFAPALSARLALLAAEGVQQAQLQLNPAEMGPVSVQITVDGQQAQIAFHAVQAETRQVLEQSLPELAAALRGQGLTLSGGGVFEQSQQQAREQAQQAASGRSNGMSHSGLPADAELLGAEANTSRMQAPRSRGVLDLYA